MPCKEIICLTAISRGSLDHKYKKYPAENPVIRDRDEIVVL